MFEEIIYDLNRKLSKQGVHLYDSFNFDSAESREELKRYGNIAVFRINYGSLQLLDGNKGMTVNGVLGFAFRADEKSVSPTKMEDILDYLISDNNGLIADSGANAGTAENGAETRETFRYVLTFDMYKPSGEMKAMSYDNLPDRYVFYDLPVQIIVSKALMFGDDFKIIFKMRTGSAYQYMPLKNVVYWEETPVSNFESPTFVNEGIQKNLFVSKSWDLKGKLMMDSENTLIRSLEYDVHNAPDTVYTVVYELGGKMYEAEAYLSLSHEGSMRQFVAVDFAFHLYGELRVLSDSEAAAIKEAITYA